MPTFSPRAAKPSARLHDVVDFPTPPLADATAMICLMPGRPAGLDVARAFTSVADTSSLHAAPTRRGEPRSSSLLTIWSGCFLLLHAPAHSRPWSSVRDAVRGADRIPRLRRPLLSCFRTF